MAIAKSVKRVGNAQSLPKAALLIACIFSEIAYIDLRRRVTEASV